MGTKVVQLAAGATLQGAGVVVGATTAIVSELFDIDGNSLTMTDFGTTGFGTMQPNVAGFEEGFQFTGITKNGNGTDTITGISHTLSKSPYTATSGLNIAHPGGSRLVLSNNPGLYNKQAFKDNDQTWTGRQIFPSDDVNNAGIVADTDTVMATAFVTLGQLSRTVVSGASNASTTVKGIVQLPTQAQVDARTAAGSTGALLALTPDKNRTVLAHDGLSSTGSANAYVLTVVPAETAYVQNQSYNFKANFANTGSCTLNVSGLGAKTLKTPGGFALVTGDIFSGQIVACYYDGTDMIVTSVLGQTKISQDGREVYLASAVGTDTYAITLVPAPSAYVNGMTIRFKADVANTGAATLNVNGLGAISLVRGISTALVTGDIVANQIVEVEYNSTGTVFQVVNPPNALVTGPTVDGGNWHKHKQSIGSGTRNNTASSGAVTYAHGLGRVPQFVTIEMHSPAGAGSRPAGSSGAYDGTNNICAYTGDTDTVASVDSSNCIHYEDTTGAQTGAITTMDATNITITWAKVSSPGASTCAFIIISQ